MRRIHAVGAALLGLALASCTPESDTAPARTSSTQSAPAAAEPTDRTGASSAGVQATDATISPVATTERRLVIYSGRSESLIGPFIESFEAETGIDVDVRWGGTAELAVTLLEEGARTPADVFLAQEPAALAAVDPMLSALPTEMLNRVPKTMRSAAGSWVGLTGRARTIVYNTDNVTEADLPPDVAGLTAPEWRGRVGWAPSNASFQAMVTAMRSQWGQDKTREWLQGMMANDVKTFDSNAPIVAAVGSGEIDAGLVNHYYLYRFLAEEGADFPARNHLEQGSGPGALLLVSAAGILDTAANRDEAEEFIAYLLSEPVQERFVAESSEYALIDGVGAPEGLPPIGDLQAASMAPEDLADLEGTLSLLREVGALP